MTLLKVKMSKIFIVLAVLFAAAHSKKITVEETVRVQVYYETLCPYSIKFITRQLYPTYISLGKERINLELIPWGHATEKISNGKRIFSCQHGPDECYGNKVHSCALDLATIEQSLEFVYCSEGSEAPTDDANLKECADTAGIAWADLQECFSSGKADELLSKNGEKTNFLNPKGIPTIVINGTYTSENEHASLKNFKNLICTLIGFPDECN